MNEPPILTGPTLDNYDENDTRPITPPYIAVDPDVGDTITWSLSGTHRNSFSIANGVIRFVDPPNHEARSSYSVGVTATDGAGLFDTINLTVNVRDVNEPPVLTVITEPDPLELAENTPVTNQVARYRATDPDAGDTYTWELSGADADDFAIDNGVLTFAATPDYEGATDSNRDNVYLVTVEADDGEASASRSITVTVTNEDEPGELDFSSGPAAGRHTAHRYPGRPRREHLRADMDVVSLAVRRNRSQQRFRQLHAGGRRPEPSPVREGGVRRQTRLQQRGHGDDDEERAPRACQQQAACVLKPRNGPLGRGEHRRGP